MVNVRVYLQNVGTAYNKRVGVGDDYRIINFVRSLLLLVVSTARVDSPHLLNVCIAVDTRNILSSLAIHAD